MEHFVHKHTYVGTERFSPSFHLSTFVERSLKVTIIYIQRKRYFRKIIYFKFQKERFTFYGIV